MRILVLEDDGMVALLLEDALGDAGHEVLGPVAASSMARTLIASEKPDLMLVDIHLTDGETGCAFARDAFSIAGVRTIFVTGSPEKARCCGDSALGVLVKPFHADAINAAVDVAASIARGETPAYVPEELQLFGQSH